MFNFNNPEQQNLNQQFNQNKKQQTTSSNNARYIGTQLPILTKFGMIFDLFEEYKIGGDGSKYTQYSVMIRIIPGKKPGEYDHNKSFTMKTKLEDVFGFSGALIAAYYGQNVSYSIMTDSSKSQFTDKSAQKSIYIHSKDGKISIGATCKFDDNNKISDGVIIDIFKAYGIAKSIEQFCKQCYKFIFNLNSKGVERNGTTSNNNSITQF